MLEPGLQMSLHVMLVALKSWHCSAKAPLKIDREWQWQRRILPVGRTLSSTFLLPTLEWAMTRDKDLRRLVDSC